MRCRSECVISQAVLAGRAAASARTSAVASGLRNVLLNRAEAECSVEQNKQYGNCQRREYCQERSIEDEHGALSFMWSRIS